MKFQQTTLKNGLRLMTVPMPIESTTVMVAVGAGTRHEAKPVNGLFHFMEHMAFKGTKKRPSSLAVALEVDGVGGEFNAFTDKEVTVYYIKVAAKHTELAFDILSDMLTNSLLKEEEIEREKGVIIEEINMYEDMPMRRVEEIFIRLLYGDNAMGRDILGTKQTIQGIQRKDFLNYQKQLYFLQNMVLMVAGKLNEKEIRSLAQRYFSGLNKSGQKTTKSIVLGQKEPRLKLISKKTEQAHFCLGVPGYWYAHPDRFTLAIIAAILGGGMSSRLFTQLRERRGLAYYVSTQPESNTDSGYLVTQAGIRLSKIDEAVKVALKEYQSLMIKKVAVKELNKAKEYLKGGLILSLEDSRRVASRFAYQVLLEEKVRTPEEVVKLIDKVKAEDVLRVARDVFQPKNFNLAIIGPYQKTKPFEKLLDLA